MAQTRRPCCKIRIFRATSGITDVKADGTLHDDTFRSLDAEVAAPYLLQDGDILLARSGATVGKSFQYLSSWGRAAYAGYLIRCRPDKSTIFPRFANYYFQTECYWACIRSTLIQATIENFSAEKYKDLTLPLPTKPEQQQIAAFLDWKTGQIDALIARKQELLEKLKEKRIAVITQAVTQGLNPAAPLRNCGIPWLGQVPKHWEVKRLKFSVSKVGSGVTPKGGAESYETEGIPLLRSQNIHFDGLRLDDIVFISEGTHQGMSNSQVASGDVLLNITGASIGRCNYVPTDFGEGNVNQHVCIIRPEAELLTKYLHLVLWSKVGQSQIDLEQSGSGREGLTFVAIKNFVVPLPDAEEQAQIVEQVELDLRRVEALLKMAEDVVARLTEYRTALITAATTGKIDVRNVKIPQPAA
jgi:type I restriction enzyme S subunit